MKYLGVIPARYQSSRFPGKPLADIAGQSMIQRVYHQALKSSALNEVVVATDDGKIFEHCNNEKMKVVMTSAGHQSGTDRVAEVAGQLEADVVINIQGDEPFIPPDYIDLLCRQFDRPGVSIATLITPLTDADMFHSPNIVKAVRRSDGRAMYFSRSPVPYRRNPDFKTTLYRHLGIYGFRRDTLLQLAGLEQGQLERHEMLEQLRWLEAGYDLMTAVVEAAPMGVDLPGDIDHIIQWMKENNLD
jgi:3-deoxy-manno-octulosonate cytidylyltransferase (CMP-KDO synthetase)